MKRRLLRFSVQCHSWLGLYLGCIVVVWLLEMALLPGMFAPGPLPAPGTRIDAGSVGTLLSGLRDAMPPGSVLAPESVVYSPSAGTYAVHDRQRFITIVVSENGEVLSAGQDTDALINAKYALGWIHPLLGSVLSAPFKPAFIILAVTGLHIFFTARGRKRETLPVLPGLAQGDSFIFQGASSLPVLRRLAALGLLPGVRAVLLRRPSTGPLIIQAGNTRVAVSRKIAAAFVFAREEDLS